MPTLVWLYLGALLYYRTSGSCVALAEALDTVSHDRLKRLLQADWSGQTLLAVAFRTLFVWERGYLILDDMVIPKLFATAMEGLAWVFSSQERQPVYGFSLVLLVWTNRRLRIPLGLRLWRKGALQVQARIGVAELCPQPFALSPGVWALPRLVPVQGVAEAHSGLRVVLCVPPEIELPVQWPTPSASSLLGGDRLAERGPQSADCQTRQKVLCHQSLAAAGRRGAPGVSHPLPNRRSDPGVQGPAEPDGLSSARRTDAAPSYRLLPHSLLCAGAGTR